MTLVVDENPDVRYHVAENYNIPDRVLKVLVEDENPYVSCRAELTLLRKHALDQAA